MPAKTADRAALTTAQAVLVEDNLVLVNHVVQSVIGRIPLHVNKDDLVSAGLLALVLCAQDFDAGRGIPFSGYAAARVRGAVIDEMRARDWASRSVRRRARELDEIRAALSSALGRAPSEVEIAEASGYGVEEVRNNTVDVARATLGSLDGHTDTQLDQLLPPAAGTPEDELVLRERLGYLRSAVAELPDRLRRVVEGYFFSEEPMAVLAEELGVTESRVSQMRAEAVQLLRDALGPVLGVTLPVTTARLGAVAAARRDRYVAQVATSTSVYERLALGTHTA